MVGIQVTCMTSEMFKSYSLSAIDAVTHLDGVEVDFHDAVFRPERLDKNREIDLEAFTCPRRLRPQEHTKPSSVCGRKRGEIAQMSV